MASKVKAGAEFIVTQVGFDLEVLRRFCETVASRDVALRAPFLVSVFIPRSVRNLEWLRDRWRAWACPTRSWSVLLPGPLTSRQPRVSEWRRSSPKRFGAAGRGRGPPHPVE